MHSLHCLIVFLSQKTKTVAAVALSALCALEVFGIWTLFSKVYSLLHYIESAMIFRNTFFPLRPWIIADAGTSFIASAKFLLNKNREASRAGMWKVGGEKPLAQSGLWIVAIWNTLTLNLWFSRQNVFFLFGFCDDFVHFNARNFLAIFYL